MEYLAIHWNIDPAILHIGGFELRWYSLLFVSGFILGWYIMKSFFVREKISTDLLDPMLYMLLICTIVGARLGHCLFYQPDYYLGSWKGFLEIFMPWKGGLASHGGTLALLLGIWWYARKYGPKNDFDFVWVLDHLVIPVSFAACFIRLGNLFNSEIYGGPTNLPWGFVFERNGETVPCHPTQLYEAGTYLLCPFPHRIHQERPGGIRGRYGPEYGSAPQHSLRPAGHRLPGVRLHPKAPRPGRPSGPCPQSQARNPLCPSAEISPTVFLLISSLL